ncbi:MAG: DNA-processing protein DprA [Eudoraea sp.]|uniref:DNA-processing protein DprA n=1 Tax=Eudoraea sp. TaxID=1979955 RepID=UPI003C74648B
MTKDELIAVLRLQNIPHIGDITAKKLIAHCGSPMAVFRDKRKHLEKIGGIGSAVISGLQNRKHLLAAEAEYEFILKNGISYSYFMDPNYPAYLKHCLDGPILLFKKGNIKLEDKKVISIVGTRNSTAYGRAFCEKFIEDIAPINPVIISGFAYGIDICAHRAALKMGLQTVACVAHGLNQIYPKAHLKYVDEINRNGGFLTEFWSTSNPDRENFLKRNRIIAGISEATIVIESAEKGGSLVTADMANSYNRDVFAVPGRVKDKYSLGCNNLIKSQKAHMITSAADLIYLMDWQLEEHKTVAVQKQLFVELDENEKTIYTFLQKTGRQLVDQIALECQLPVFKTVSSLLTMEMKGMIRPLPGKQYEAI